jgi:diguanylate cyclase (GGDEF)-like protein
MSMVNKTTGSANADLLPLALLEIPLPVFIINLQGNFVWVSNEFAALFNREAESLHEVPLETVLPSEPFHFLKSGQDIGTGSTPVELFLSLTLHEKQRSFRIIMQPWRKAVGDLNGFVGVLFETKNQEEQRGQLENKSIQEKLRKNQLRAEALGRLSQSLSEAGLDYKMILSSVAQGIGGLFGDICVIRLLSETDNFLDLSAFYSPLQSEKSELDDWLVASRHPANQGYWKEVIAEGRPVLLAHLELQNLEQFTLSDFMPEEGEPGSPCLMIAPMRTMQGVIGAITLARTGGREPYNSEDLDLLKELAQRSAFAIESARLYESEARRLHELDSLYSATRALLTTLDYETLLGRILDAAISAIPAAEKGILNLMAPETGKLEIRAMFGYKDPRIRTSTRRRIHGYTALAIQQRKPMLIHDATMEGLYGLLEGEAEDLPVRSIIIAPLILDDQALGALILSASNRSAFTQDDLRLLESFAATISAAINNSLLHSRMQRLAITDSVTNLYNRRGFYELARREIERARRFGHSLSVIMMDLDQLKSVNDTYGHAVGDQVLRALADRLSQHVREFDILCRYGGDEFALLLPETDLFMASSVAERLRASIADEPINTDGGPVPITISLGVTKATPNISNLEELLKSADRALYAAKQGGRNRLEIT